ncbi:hypothetical protein BGW37DRAFT_477649 [Umbelopsis sp. PMI_123]|nr:hypothetical protein BGW37DRAFT_477649 [Umbelopsis sp. PMI_123]
MHTIDPPTLETTVNISLHFNLFAPTTCITVHTALLGVLGSPITLSFILISVDLSSVVITFMTLLSFLFSIFLLSF